MNGPWAPVLWFLLLAGAARGVLEYSYILLRAGHFLITLTQPYALRTYLLTGSAFLAANVVTAFVRWVMFAFTVFALGRWLGGRGSLDQLLRVFGPALIVYPLTILPDFLHLAWRLPAIQFSISPVYNPVIETGQVLASIWLAVFGYAVARRVHGLSRFDSVLVGVALELLSLGSLVIGSLGFFNVPAIQAMDHDRMVVTATVAFTLAAAALGAVTWLLGRKVGRRPGDA